MFNLLYFNASIKLFLLQFDFVMDTHFYIILGFTHFIDVAIILFEASIPIVLLLLIRCYDAFDFISI